MLRRFIVLMLVLQLSILPCFGWSESGHHLIGILAFDLLPQARQQQLLEILRAHPRLREDFQPPDSLSDRDQQNRWQVGRAAYWPDVARSQPEYHRSTWHYQLGAALTIGGNLSVPATPGAPPAGASLSSQELHIAQAIEVCRRTLRDRSRSLQDRAVAICWIAHLVGDAHQPCHAGSLYYEGVFPEGDRGANSLKTRQNGNLHAVWDGLFGSDFDLSATQAQARAMIGTEAWQDASAGMLDITTRVWLSESAAESRRSVYTPEVLNAVEAAHRSGTTTVELIDLPDAYLQNATAVARQRASLAAHRLAAILSIELSGEEPRFTQAAAWQPALNDDVVSPSPVPPGHSLCCVPTPAPIRLHCSAWKGNVRLRARLSRFQQPVCDGNHKECKQCR